MATTIEKRYIRIEDWNGNIYYPESSSGATTAGQIMDASDASTDLTIGAVTYTEGVIVEDNTANNKSAILMAESDATKAMFVTEFDALTFGKIAVDIRMKSSVVTSDTVYVSVSLYYIDHTTGEDGILIDSKNITGSMIGKENEYVDVIFGSNYSGVNNGNTSLRVKIYANGGTGATMYFDQLAVAKAFPGI